MANSVKFGEDTAQISGTLPATGNPAPDFKLAGGDLGERSLADYSGRTKVLSIFPSIDTPTCAASVRAFNERVAAADGAAVLCISKDLPFAAKRFCAGEGIASVECLSAFRDADFGRDYGIEVVDGPLKGLFARAVLVLDRDNKIIYSQLVGNIKDEPDYGEALAALAKA